MICLDRKIYNGNMDMHNTCVTRIRVTVSGTKLSAIRCYEFPDATCDSEPEPAVSKEKGLTGVPCTFTNLLPHSLPAFRKKRQKLQSTE